MTRKLPVGIQDFETIRTENYLYVDKTQLIHQMITQGQVYFLSRPRRFGKSLLISTLHAIFKGKRHLFKDLWIDKSDYTWEHYPVIWLDMAGVTHSSAEDFRRSLSFHLDEIAERYGIKLPTPISVSDRLSKLITELSKNNQKVVVLIDEYDSPLINQIHQPATAMENREIIKQFYGILKVQNANIHFVLLTGVSKFSKVSIFSGLNNLRDISLSTDYATLLGYTEQELTNYFEPEISRLAHKEGLSYPALIDKIRRWYNGYRFSEEGMAVYNPFSTLLLFTEQKFSDYWFETATPTFLLKLIQQQKFDITAIENLVVGKAAFSTYEIDELDVLPLLYQTGYLTIKCYNRESDDYELGYPNSEVRTAFLDSLLTHFSKVGKHIQSACISKMVAALKGLSFDAFFESLQGFLASIPYELFGKDEKFYQTIFYLVFKLTGAQINTEVHTNRGRIDAVIAEKERILIFELKVDKTAQEALEQIKAKGYADQYRAQQKAIYAIGLNFNTKERNLSDYVVEQLE